MAANQAVKSQSIGGQRAERLFIEFGQFLGTSINQIEEILATREIEELTMRGEARE